MEESGGGGALFVDMPITEVINSLQDTGRLAQKRPAFRYLGGNRVDKPQSIVCSLELPDVSVDLSLHLSPEVLCSSLHFPQDARHPTLLAVMMLLFVLCSA